MENHPIAFLCRSTDIFALCSGNLWLSFSSFLYTSFSQHVEFVHIDSMRFCDQENRLPFFSSFFLSLSQTHRVLGSAGLSGVPLIVTGLRDSGILNGRTLLIFSSLSLSFDNLFLLSFSAFPSLLSTCLFLFLLTFSLILLSLPTFSTE